MKLLKILLIVGVAAFGYKSWSQYQLSRERAALAQLSPGGFLPVGTPGQAAPGEVYILAPLNCPSSEAQRAEALAARLKELGIPTRRGSSFTLQASSPSEEERARLERVAHILRGPAPAVFVNGMGKSDPTLEEVLAEYRRPQ